MLDDIPSKFMQFFLAIIGVGCWLAFGAIHLFNRSRSKTIRGDVLTWLSGRFFSLVQLGFDRIQLGFDKKVKGQLLIERTGLRIKIDGMCGSLRTGNFDHNRVSRSWDLSSLEIVEYLSLRIRHTHLGSTLVVRDQFTEFWFGGLRLSKADLVKLQSALDEVMSDARERSGMGELEVPGVLRQMGLGPELERDP